MTFEGATFDDLDSEAILDTLEPIEEQNGEDGLQVGANGVFAFVSGEEPSSESIGVAVAEAGTTADAVLPRRARLDREEEAVWADDEQRVVVGVRRAGQLRTVRLVRSDVDGIARLGSSFLDSGVRSAGAQAGYAVLYAPLATVQGFAKTMLRIEDLDPEKQTRYLGLIDAASLAAALARLGAGSATYGVAAREPMTATHGVSRQTKEPFVQRTGGGSSVQPSSAG